MRVVGLLEVLVLAYLSEVPMCGKDLVEKIKQKTKGLWKVSYGSIYPLLNKLQKSGYLELSKQDRKKIYGVTSGGMEYYSTAKENLMKELVSNTLDYFPLVLELMPEEDKWKNTISRLITARKKLYSLVQAFPHGQKADAKLKILADIADLLDYYTQGVKHA
jgi:DNA-binding PadR family transcriptional regulator